MKRVVFLLCFVAGSFFSATVNAQIEDLGVIMQGGVQDANTLLQAYIQPFGAGFGAGLNTGWINSARTHKNFGFHLKAGLALVPIPESERYFTLRPGDLTTLSIVNPEIGRSPTVVGYENDPTYRFQYLANIDPDGSGPIPSQQIELANFSMPSGLIPADFEQKAYIGVASPMIQFGLGLGNATEVMLRYIPEQDFREYGKVSLMGAGAKFSLTEMIADPEELEEARKPFDLSLVGAYTIFDYNVPLSLPDPSTGVPIPNQKMEWETNAWNVNLVAGLTPSRGWFRHILEPSIYFGVGYEQANTKLNLSGRYGYNVARMGVEQVEYVTDPIHLKLDSPNSIRYIAGVRMRILSLLFTNIEYTKSNYSTFTAGVGIMIRG